MNGSSGRHVSKRIWLVGPMGAGKSTIGRRLAEHLGIDFIDMDERIVQAEGKSIPEIFAKEGEAAFRKKESAMLDALSRMSGPMVVACGGGVVLAKTNRELLRRSGVVIWLDASPVVVAERIAGDRNRPLMVGVDVLAKAKSLDAMRRPLYQDVADLRLPTDEMNVDQAVDAICRYLSEYYDE